MSTPTYCQIVAKVRRLCTALSLQLPTHETAIAAQIRNLRSVHQNLEITRAKVRLLTVQSWRLIQQDEYRELDQLLHHLITEVINMILLAEEFTADPEGTLSCLRNVNQRKDILIEEIHRLALPSHQLANLPSALSKSQLQTRIHQLEISA